MAINILSKEEVKRKVDTGEDVIIIDARPEEIYTEDSDQIEGAIHLPEAFEHEVYMGLPKNKEYIIYASKGNEDLSRHMADFLREKGFTAYALKGGYEEWRDSALPIEPINASGTPME
ncbi:MAG: rhodanese-like domain-containing protein [Candidatus Gastranaerophilales bacterium]|nr:rhodanese-like domain-containing protein [Candidatus Gastranaerophilales bacterium]